MENKGVQDVDLENAPAVMKQTKDMRSIRLADLPESVAEELKMLDVDESGTLSTSEIVESVRMYRESRRQYGIAMKIIIALCIFALIQIAAIVGTVWALLVKVKDTDTNDVDGQTTLTKSGSDDLIHTGLATKIYSLRSDLPDSVLEQADHIRLTSPTGNDASFKVAAHFRIGEKERPILKVVLQDVGMVSVDGEELFFSTSVGDVLEAAGFTTRGASGPSGRRLRALAEDHETTIVSTDTISTAPSGDLPPNNLVTVGTQMLPRCTDQVMQDTKAAMTQQVDGRCELNYLYLAWRLDEQMDRATRATHPELFQTLERAGWLQCNPDLDIDDLQARPLPENVQRVMRVLPQSKWRTLVKHELVSSGGGSGPGPTTGAGSDKETYQIFLNLIARAPSICNEQGAYTSKDEACMRELASIFAHATQETGGSSNPKWESLMTYTREMNCYPFKCDSYNIGKENFDNLPADAIFYGRGMKQLTYVSNYLLAGVGLLGYDNYRTILETPDLLADSFEMILATGLDFYKRVQPPKPSMQEVILGWYKPNTPNVIAGTEVTADGSLLDKFMASISIINGGIECSPRTENECLSLTDAQVAAIAGDTNIDDKQGWREGQCQFGVKATRNRFKYYKGILTDVFNADLTPVEDAYDSVYEGFTGKICTMPNGNPWVNPEIIRNPTLYISTLPSGCGGTKKCCLISYQVEPFIFDITDDGAVSLCREEDVRNQCGSQPPPSPTPSPSPTPPPSPTPTPSPMPPPSPAPPPPSTGCSPCDRQDEYYFVPCGQCTREYQACLQTIPAGNPQECQQGLLFDPTLQGCNFAVLVDGC